MPQNVSTRFSSSLSSFVAKESSWSQVDSGEEIEFVGCWLVVGGGIFLTQNIMISFNCFGCLNPQYGIQGYELSEKLTVTRYSWEEERTITLRSCHL